MSSISFDPRSSEGSGGTGPDGKMCRLGSSGQCSIELARVSLPESTELSPGPLLRPKRMWTAGLRRSASMRRTRDPFRAQVIALKAETELFPSAGRVLVIIRTLGGEPGLERRIAVLKPRSASAILDQD